MEVFLKSKILSPQVEVQTEVELKTDFLEESHIYVHCSLLKIIFFGNYFYGLCSVALTIESMLQQRYPLNEWTYFLGVFVVTIWYYTLSYSSDKPAHPSNPRTTWYSKNARFVKVSQWGM